MMRASPATGAEGAGPPLAVGASLGLLAAIFLWRRREAIGRNVATPLPASAE